MAWSSQLGHSNGQERTDVKILFPDRLGKIEMTVSVTEGEGARCWVSCILASLAVPVRTSAVGRLLFLEMYPVELQAQVSRGYSWATFLVARKEKATSTGGYVHFVQMHLLPDEVTLYTKLGRTALLRF